MADLVQLVEHASDPALVVDAERRVLAWNAAAEALLGRSAEDALGRSCAEVLGLVLPDGEVLCREKCDAMTGFAVCRPYAVSRCFAMCKDGSRVSVGASSMAVPGTGSGGRGEPIAVIFLHPKADAELAGAEGRLCIRTLGHFAVSVGGVDLALDQWPRKQAVQLFKFLAFRAGRPTHREQLSEYLWPDAGEDQARSRLKVTIHFLRQKLREAGIHDEIVATEGSSYVLRDARIWVDATAFEHLAASGREHQRAGRMREAVHDFEEARRLYRGDFMEADQYADWCAEERVRLSETFLDVLSRLAELYAARGDHASAAQACHAALVVEPCREDIHYALMRSLVALNRTERAIAQYRRCRQILRDELGVEPSPKTESLFLSLTSSARPAAR